MSNTITHRITYAETDRMGFAYYGNYMVWFEMGRTELIRGSGLSYRALEEMGFLLPVIEATCRYHKPARYDDVVTIRTSVSTFRGIRLGFNYVVLRGDELLAEGTTLHAFMDKDGKPRKLPKDVRDRIEDAART